MRITDDELLSIVDSIREMAQEQYDTIRCLSYGPMEELVEKVNRIPGIVPITNPYDKPGS